MVDADFYAGQRQAPVGKQQMDGDSGGDLWE